MNGLTNYLSLRGIDSPSFFVYNVMREIYFMDRDKLKLMIRNLELLVDSLKAEIYSDIDAYKHKPDYNQVASYLHEYDEVFEDSDLNEDF